MSLDRALDGVPFEIDLIRCFEAARQLSTFSPVDEVHPWNRESKRSQFVFKTLFVSICHQFNWDYLQSALASWLLPNPIRHLAEAADCTPSRIGALLSDYPKQERVRASERAHLLRDTAQHLSAMLSDGSIETLMRRKNLEGVGGFYSTIGQLRAFQGDPLEKKIRVLAHDLHRERILVFADPENLKPAVEYHLIRLYLRTGRVYPTDSSVRELLVGDQERARRRLVMTLRGQVDEAMRQTALYAGLDIATLNYIEWQIARSTCLPALSAATANAHCRGKSSPELPPDVSALTTDGCPFTHTCRSLNDAEYGWYHEPQFEKAIY